MTRLPYEGLRIVSIEQAVSAPFATRQFADLGADVIKIERPDGGDFARSYDTNAAGGSAYFVWLNTNKRSVCLDIRTPEGLGHLRRLLATADVFVHNLGPGAIGRLGLSHEQVARDFPTLINCQISGFGIDGPFVSHKAYDMLIQQEAGIPSVTGTEAEPAKVGVSIADIGSGMYAYASIQTALWNRAQTGQGDYIDISMLECMTEWMSPILLTFNGSGTVLKRQGVRHNMLVPYGRYRCSDGFINLATQNNREWQTLRGALDLADRPDYATNALRVENREALEAELETRLSEMTCAQALTLLDDAGVPYGAINGVAAVSRHEQLTARDRWMTIEHEAGSVLGLLPPHNLSSVQVRQGPVPKLGEHTDEVLAELG